MAAFELIMPKMGESIMEATILKWLKQEGETIEEEESVLEIATDKVDSEVPAPVEGTLQKIMFQEGDVVPVGAVIALITPQGETASQSNTKDKQTKPITKEQAPASNGNLVVANKNGEANNKPSGTSGGRFYSPLVLNMARKEGIAMSELEQIPGTGKDQRVTKRDMLGYIKTRSTQSAPSVLPKPLTQTKSAPSSSHTVIQGPKVDRSGNVEIVEMDRMRRLIADHMVMSKHVSPHVTSFIEVDVTPIVEWRNRVKDEFFKREGEKLTFTPIFIEAAVKAIKDYPMINSSIDGNQIIIRKDINMGIATALPTGNLIVPVVKNAENMNLVGLAKSLNDKAARARANKLKPDEVQGGTFTLSNIGSFGSVMGTPIINQPQVAIMAVGSIRKKPAVVETEYGDLIAIRHQMFLSLSYDHRVVDGALGSMYLKRVAEYLESFDTKRSF